LHTQPKSENADGAFSFFSKYENNHCQNRVEMKVPKINLKELDEAKKQNQKERLAFLDFYAQWIKKKRFKPKPSQPAKKGKKTA